MSSNEDILLEMLNRALLPQNPKPDKLAIEIMSTLIRNSGDKLVDFTKKALLKEIHSTDINRAIKTIHILQECFEKSGGIFQKEIAKYRFLNELIRMISKKYLGNTTPMELQNEIMNFLSFCSIQYPQFKNFNESYNLLKNEDFQVVQTPPPPAASAEPRPNIFLNKSDEMKFLKLLKSTNKDDVRKANLYLKHFYEKEQERTELKIKTQEELKEYEETVKLLESMLDSNSHELALGNVLVPNNGEAPLDVIKELFERCVKYQTILKQMPNIVEPSDNLMETIIQVSRDIENAITKYKRATQSQTAAPRNDDLIGVLAEGACYNGCDKTVTELQDVFSCMDILEDKTSPNDIDSLLLDTNLLLPQPMMTVPGPDNHKISLPHTEPLKKSRLSELDKLSEDLLKEQLEAINITKALKTQQSNMTADKLSLNFLKEKEAKVTNLLENDDVSLDKCILDEPTSTPKLSLAEISLTLDDVIPSTDLEKILLDEDLKITMNFTMNKPCKNTSVLVVSITNKSKLPVEEISLDASVKKPSKVRVLYASANSLPGLKPFRPVESINQIVLLYNPTQAPVDLTCIVSYKPADDPDFVKECLIAKDIPFTD